MKPIPVRAIACAGAVVLSACSSYGPPRAGLGSPVDAVTRQMGQPTGEYALPGGGRRLEFARGPLGKHTYMVDFDADGRLLQSEQVLTEARFNTVRPGMTTDEVRSLLGRPSEEWAVARPPQTVWSYRYESPFCQWFMVGVDRRGRVQDTSYGPDPLCDGRDIDVTWNR